MVRVRRRRAPRRYIARRGTKKYAKRKTTYNRTNKGFIKLQRKALEVAISNSGTVGGVTTVDPSTSILAVGPTALSVGSGAGYDVPFSLKFRLNQIINHTDITTLCDSYKIAGVYVRIYYNKTGSAAGATAGMPYIEYITDHDDALPPTVLELREKMGVKLKTFKNESSYIGIKAVPKAQYEVYTAAGTALAVPRKNPWLNAANDAVDHYAIKGVIHNMYLPGGAALTEVFKIDVSYVILGKDFQ